MTLREKRHRESSIFLAFNESGKRLLSPSSSLSPCISCVRVFFAHSLEFIT